MYPVGVDPGNVGLVAERDGVEDLADGFGDLVRAFLALTQGEDGRTGTA